jgi:YD repeat-containing protein
MVYDALNRLTSKYDKGTSSTALASYAYAYDADGNITSGKSAQQTGDHDLRCP